MTKILDRIHEARTALQALETELVKAEYLTTCRLPQVEHLQGALGKHVETLASSLVSLAKARFDVTGVCLREMPTGKVIPIRPPGGKPGRNPAGETT